MKCYWQCQKSFLRLFYSYGHFLGKHPLWFLLVPVVVCGALGVGFLFVDPENDVEKLYAPMNSPALDAKDKVIEHFPDLSGKYFDAFSVNKLGFSGTVIFRSLKPQSILTPEVLAELEDFYEEMLNLSVIHNGESYSYMDICAVRNGYCAIDHFVFTAEFLASLKAGNVTYPMWFTDEIRDLSVTFGNVFLAQNISLQAAGSFRMTFPLRQDTVEYDDIAKEWEKAFIEFMETKNFSTVEFVYAASQSLPWELDKGTSGDIVFISLSFTIMISYVSIVSSGGDCVSNRAFLANAGVLATGLGILGAFGLITMTGVRFVNIVGVMPYLVLGIGVDDMFLLMSSWSETTAIPGLTVPERIGTVFKQAGLGITITSVTDFLAFAIGSTSVFRSVRNFCIYTGIGVFMCYLCNATFFSACLTLHGKRVYSRRHSMTCKPVSKSRKQMRAEGHSWFYSFICGGSIPGGPDEDQSLCERGPRIALTKFIMWTPVRVLVPLIFMGYLGVAIWGCTQLKQGLELKDLVMRSSYFHKFQEWDTEDFGVKIPVSFVITTPLDYTNPKVVSDYRSLLNEALENKLVDPIVEKCWLFTYMNTPFYNQSNPDNFIPGLQMFLFNVPTFMGDVSFSNDSSSITASRCQVYSTELKDSNIQVELMEGMRSVATNSPLDVFAYHPSFVYFDQFVSVLPSTLQTVGITLAVMCVVTTIFLPHPIIVMLVMLQVVMIVVGIFGYMALWGLTLSSITMIHLIMSVGFSVDFCAHVCTAYMVSEETTRHARAQAAIIHASGPIFNGGFSSFIGISVIIFSDSYIFQSFFKIMLLVIGFGVVHAVFLIPVLLSFIGPKGHADVYKANLPDNIETESHVEPDKSQQRNGVETSHSDISQNGHVTNINETFRNSAYDENLSSNIISEHL